MNSFFDRIPRYFFLFFVIFFVTIFLAFYEFFREYRAEADLFVLSKSAAISSETAARTIAIFPATLGFYERLLSDHEEIEDPWTKETKYERKTSWARVIDSSVISGTSLIRLSVSSASAEQSIPLLEASLETLYGFSGRLYDRETEADIRLLEEITVRPMFRSFWALLLLSAGLSGIFAFSVSSLFQKYVRALSLPKFSLRRAPTFPLASEEVGSIRPVGVFQDISRPEMQSNSLSDASRVPVSSEVVSEGKSVRVGSVISSIHEKKQAMPGNLETVSAKDFAWEKVLSPESDTLVKSRNLEANANASLVSSASSEAPSVAPEKREPTPEELKARLNQLLRGEM